MRAYEVGGEHGVDRILQRGVYERRVGGADRQRERERESTDSGKQQRGVLLNTN